jgi:hypothetical protein
MKLNDLQNNQPQSRQTMRNLVKHGQNKPIRFGLRVVLRQLQPLAFSLQPFRKFGLAPGAAVVTVLLRGHMAFAVVFRSINY